MQQQTLQELPIWIAHLQLLLQHLVPTDTKTELAIQRPLSWHHQSGRTVDRDSSTFGVEQVNYGNVETAEEVGWDAYKRTVDGIMEMLHRTGLAHGYSYNTWSDVVSYTPEFVENWLSSPQTSMYYSLQVYAEHSS